MAIYRLEAKIIGREKRGRSVVAAAAYRAGTKLRDELQGKVYDYARRLKGIVDSRILTPEDAPAWAHEPQSLWNRVERGEKRKDAQLAREFILAVPHELGDEAQFAVAAEWARKELVSRGMVAEVSLHHDRAERNPHVHILCTLRKLDKDGFGTSKPREWNDVAFLVHQRESWAEAVNAALEQAGRPERVDHRSLKDRGIDRTPEPKIGVAATAMKRRGVETDPERFQIVRRVKLLNELRPMVRAVRAHGEIHQKGMGASWWEKSVTFLSRVRGAAGRAVGTAWRSLVGPARTKEEKDDPQISR